MCAAVLYPIRTSAIPGVCFTIGIALLSIQSQSAKVMCGMTNDSLYEPSWTVNNPKYPIGEGVVNAVYSI